jgi:diaminopimelate decarboxylase
MRDGGSAGFREREGELWCEEVPLSRIAEQVGTPCYVYSETVIQERYQAFVSAFAGLDFRVFYSVKANHNLSLLRLIRSLGAGADVVSVGELHRAQLSGFGGSDIIFGGVGKRRDELEAALDAGVLIINAESEGELRRLNEVAGLQGTRAPVAIRVNPGVEPDTHAYTQTGHYRTKFGVALEDAADLFALASGLEHLDPVGIDTHIGSQILSPGPYREAIAHLADLARRVRQAGTQLRYFDIGGGYGLEHDGDAQFDLATLAGPLGEVVSELGMMCLMEPGRWLIAPAGALLARVLYTKQLGDKQYYVTDTGSNDFLRPSYYGAYHPVVPVRRRDGSTVADIVGPVCETGDFLALDRQVPSLCEGDVIAVGYTGAYGFVMSSNYNSRPRAAEVMVRGDGFRVIRRRETLDDLVAGEALTEADEESSR